MFIIFKECFPLEDLDKPPMKPAQTRIAGLQQNVKRDQDQLQRERQQQRKQRDSERLRKRLQTR